MLFKGDTRSLDYVSYENVAEAALPWNLRHALDLDAMQLCYKFRLGSQLVEEQCSKGADS